MAASVAALAGAGDSAGLERWLQSGYGVAPSRRERLVEQAAVALHALASRSYRQASSLLRAILPDLSLIGGSHAQNRIFDQLVTWSAGQVDGASLHQVRLHAA